MKQKMTLGPKYKQTFHLNMKMQNSLDFLKLNENELQSLIHSILQTNPFIEVKENEDHSFNYLENIAKKKSLKDELYLQMHILKKEYDENVISYLIESLNNKGFLSFSKEQYLIDLHIDEDTFNKNLTILQSFEPIGVGAYDCYDSICIQLKYKKLYKSYQIMRESKELILNTNYKDIQKKYHLSFSQVKDIFDDIRSCHPFPCLQYDTGSESYITPDIEIIVDNNEIIIEPYNHYTFNVNNHLFEFVKENQKMREYFQEANFFIENLTKRNQTVLMVSNALINIQRNHFLYDDELIPCTLEEISEKCHYHISTISRTINSKYYLFHNEVYPLKNLLVSKSSLGDSSDAIKKAMKNIIDNEDKKNPLSDQEIVDALTDFDLYCSRRVINKYRKQMNIPSSNKRKRL